MNVRGQLLGIVNGRLDNATTQVGITPAQDVNTFLRRLGKPGLAG